MNETHLKLIFYNRATFVEKLIHQKIESFANKCYSETHRHKKSLCMGMCVYMYTGKHTSVQVQELSTLAMFLFVLFFKKGFLCVTTLTVLELAL